MEYREQEKSLDSINDLGTWLTKSGHKYRYLHSAHVLGKARLIAFSFKDCKYYTAPRREATPEEMKILLNYLRWEYDKFVPEMKEVEVEVDQEYETKSGKKAIRKVKKKVEKPTGNYVNEFPATTENMLKKRQEIMTELVSQGAATDQVVINAHMKKIAPVLSDHEAIRAALQGEHVSDLQKTINEIKRGLS